MRNIIINSMINSMINRMINSNILINSNRQKHFNVIVDIILL